MNELLNEINSKIKEAVENLQEATEYFSSYFETRKDLSDKYFISMLQSMEELKNLQEIKKSIEENQQ